MTVKATDPRSGFFTFVHHNVPVEYSWDIDERIRVIQTLKPESEKAIRLRALTYIPESLVPRAYAEAQRAFDEAGRALTEAERAFDETGCALTEAGRAYDPELQELALKLAPGTPWNGRELVFNDDDGGC